MKRIKVFLIAVFLLVITACSPSHDVTVNVALDSDFKGEIILEFSILKSAIGEEETLESVQTKIMRIIKNGDRFKEELLSTRIVSNELIIEYEESFSNQTEFETTMSRLKGETFKVEYIDEDGKGDPLLNATIVSRFDIEAESMIQWIYDQIEAQQVFGDDSSSIDLYLSASSDLIVNDESVSKYDDIYFADPVTIKKLKQYIKVTGEDTFDLTISFDILDDEKFDKDKIKQFFESRIEDIKDEEVVDSISLVHEEKDGSHVFTIESKNVTDSDEIYYYLMDDFNTIEMETVKSSLEDSSDEAIKEIIANLSENGITVKNRKELEAMSLLSIDFYLDYNEYHNIIEEYETVIDLGGYKIVAADGRVFDIKDYADVDAKYEGGVLSYSGSDSIAYTFLLKKDNLIMSILKWVGIVVVAILVALAGFFGFKKVKKTLAEKEAKKTETTTELVEETVKETTVEIKVDESEKVIVADEKISIKEYVNLVKGEIVSSIKDKYTFIPALVIFAIAIVISIIVLIAYNQRIASMLEVTDYFDMMSPDMFGYFDILKVVLSSGLGFNMLMFGVSTRITISFVVMLIPFVYFGLGSCITKFVYSRLNIKLKAYQLFTRFILAVVIITLFSFILAIIPIKMASSEIEMFTVTVTKNGIGFLTLFVNLILGVIISYFAAYGLRKPEFASNKTMIIIRYVTKKIILLTLVTLIITLISAIQTTGFSVFYIIGNMIPFILLIGLGGSLSGVVPNDASSSINMGAFYSDKFYLSLLLIFVVVVFMMFYDVRKLKKDLQINDSIKFTIWYYLGTMLFIIIFGMMAGVAVSVVGMQGAKVTFGTNYASLIIVTIVTVGAVYLLVEVFKGVSDIDSIQVKVDSIVSKFIKEPQPDTESNKEVVEETQEPVVEVNEETENKEVSVEETE